MTSDETDEIEKIMSEIEELQKEMAPASDIGPALTSQSGQTGPTGKTTEIAVGLEETLAELKQEEATGGALHIEETIQEETNEEPMPHTNPTGEGTLSLTLNGNMTLKLKYEFDNQEITIGFVDQALHVQMTDGTEFKIPVSRAQVSTSQAKTSSGSNIKQFKKAV